MRPKRLVIKSAPSISGIDSGADVWRSVDILEVAIDGRGKRDVAGIRHQVGRLSAYCSGAHQHPLALIVGRP